MKTKAFTIHHFITPLVTKGGIDGDTEADLYNEALKRLEEIKVALLPLGATVIANTDRKGIMMKAMQGDYLDAISDKDRAHPIVPAIQQSTRDYKESVALVFFRRNLNQENDLGGEEIWVEQAEVENAIRQAFGRIFDRDDYAQRMRFDRTLTRLKNDNLITERKGKTGPEYRGTKWLAIALTLDDIRTFEANCGEVLHTFGPTKQDASEAADAAELADA